MTRHLVLVGLPGSGKSTAGHRAALLLNTAFSDLDMLVAQAAALSVADLFARSGEATFRRMERGAMDGALAAPPHVIAPGAGWMSQPGNLEAAGNAHLIYLRIDPETAARRLGNDASRPLLAGSDPLTRLRALLLLREPFYLRAATEIDASGPAEDVAGQVVRIARDKAGW